MQHITELEIFDDLLNDFSLMTFTLQGEIIFLALPACFSKIMQSEQRQNLWVAIRFHSFYCWSHPWKEARIANYSGPYGSGRYSERMAYNTVTSYF